MTQYKAVETPKELSFKLPVKVKAVDTYEEASAIYQAYRDVKGLGSSRLRPLILVNKAGNEIAHISYNGRVWKGADLMSNTREEILIDQNTVKAFYDYYKTKIAA